MVNKKGSILIEMDGNAWCAVRKDTFVDIQESLCGFGTTPDSALSNLLASEFQKGV